MRLSILVCTIPSRFHLMASLCRILANQLTDEVELIWLGDNKRRSIGEKRNALLSMAQGEFVVFIDDDDVVERCYVESILSALDSRPDADCVVFRTMTHRADTGTHKLNLVGIEYSRTENNDVVTCPPTHTMVWRKSLIESVRFPDISEGEDVDWVDRACRKLDPKKQVLVDRVLYHYYYDPKVSERP